MEIKQRIGIWGQFGDANNIADGQAIRTTTILNILEKKYGKMDVFKVSTWNWKKRPFSFLIKTIRLIQSSENILILPADNGFRIIVPLIDVLNKLYKRNIIFIIIGGFLPKLLKKHPKYIMMINKFSASFSQTKGQIEELKQLGVKKLQLLPNIRLFTRISDDEILKTYDNKIKLIFFSRITEDKGVKEAINGVKLANEILGYEVIELDFYGIISKKYNNKFYSLLKENKNFISYKGVAKFDQSIDIMKKYFALIFPTYYYGEGQAGVFLDSYFSALPIIATDWKYNNEFVKNDFNGILVPIKDSKSIAYAIIKLYKDRDFHYNLRKNALSISYDYEPNELIKPLINMIK